MMFSVSASHADDEAWLTAVPLAQVSITDAFWSPKYDVWRRVTIGDCLEKFEKDGTLDNFDHVARGELDAKHGGLPWFDGLLYEMIRGSADFMANKPDAALKARLDSYIDRIAAAAAKDPGGYINTYTTMKEPTHRWGQNGGNDRFQHDLYNLGCLTEAGVHYYRSTGETKLLATAVRAANLMCKTMGPPPKQNIVPGHAMPEEAIAELAQLFKAEPTLKDRIGAPVNADDYLALAKFWIDARGNHEGRTDFGAYNQDGGPALQQQTIEGHAVRAALFGSGMIAVGETMHAPEYTKTATRLWGNMVGRRMYITGGIGSSANAEKFGPDYVLPNDGYLETCAAVASCFFSQNLHLARGDAHTIDELERSLYNNALAGVSLAGNSYFYENPLQCSPKRARWTWHECPCCPPMFLKLMGAMPGYIYSTDAAGGVYVNLFVGSAATLDREDQKLTLAQTTDYPWNGNVRLTVGTSKPATFDLQVRVPAWTRGGESFGGLYSTAPSGPDTFVVSVNGEVQSPQIERGYAKLNREWKDGDVVEIRMAMPVQRVTADERVEADRNQVALQRGPLIYCIESADQPVPIGELIVSDDVAITPERRPDLLGGITTLCTSARHALPDGSTAPADLLAIPYFANANRGPVEMRTWIRRTEK
jgi:DUF1680 family protein